MQLKILIVSSALLVQVAAAQDAATPPATSQATVTTSQQAVSTPIVEPSSNAVSPAATPPPPASASSSLGSILDYKSVYEAATVEEEVKMATDRFKLTPSQQDVWMAAAIDRRETEKQARDKIDSKLSSWEKEGAYRGLRTSLNTFHETIIGYLTPAQKDALEADRLVLAEKQKKIAKLPPPAPVKVDTVAPVDSAAIKAATKDKATGKKSKKKKKSAG